MKDSSKQSKLPTDEQRGDRSSWNAQQGILGKGFTEVEQSWFSKRFNITDEDMALGIRHVKAVIRKQYRQLAKLYHPDTTIKNKIGKRRGKVNGCTFRDITRIKKYVESLDTIPITLDNLEAVLEVNKGYVSTRDVYLPWE